MAQDPKYADVQFVSICCDKLDDARSIIEKDDEMRWQHVSHYFMTEKDKEEAKKQLGFKSVPFYVVLDKSGDITQSGSDKVVDFDDVPGVVREVPVEKKEESISSLSSSLSVPDLLDDVPGVVRGETDKKEPSSMLSFGSSSALNFDFAEEQKENVAPSSISSIIQQPTERFLEFDDDF
jgi:hypothetical protein